MKKRGFTIIELMVVVIVIAIITGISTTAYVLYQNRASSQQAKVLAESVKSGAERYYNVNNEYPLALTVFGGTPTGSAPASYTTASQVLDVPATTLSSSGVKLIPCSGSCPLTDTTKVFYLTKATAASAANESYTAGSCTITFPNTETGSASFMAAWYDRGNSRWVMLKSNYGKVSTSGTCYTN